MARWAYDGSEPLRTVDEILYLATQNYSFTEMSLRNADVVKAMGMLDGLLTRWGRDRFRVLDRQIEASDRAAALSSIIKFLRLAMQSLVTKV